MEPKSPYELFLEMVEADNRKKELYESLRDEIKSWLMLDVFDFAHFAIKSDYHKGLLPVNICGMSHDWSLMYDEPKKRSSISYVGITFSYTHKNEKEAVIDLQIEYLDGTTIYAHVPVVCLTSFDAFHGWYEAEKNNYDTNCVEIKKRVQEREAVINAPDFANWMKEGKRFFDIGFVKLTELAEEHFGDD